MVFKLFSSYQERKQDIDFKLKFMDILRDEGISDSELVKQFEAMEMLNFKPSSLSEKVGSILYELSPKTECNKLKIWEAIVYVNGSYGGRTNPEDCKT